MKRFPAYLFLVFVMVANSGCSTMFGYLPLEFDKFLGEQGEMAIVQQTGPDKMLVGVKNKKLQQKLDSMVAAILQSGLVVHQKNFNWTITAIDNDQELNAFCLPGGKMFVYSGLIKFLETEDQLAGVLAHEIAHADERHGAKQLAKNLGISLIITYFVGSDLGTLAQAGSELLLLGFSRSDESDADKLAVKYLYKTNYNPKEVSGFFEKMLKEKEGNQPPQFLSTHPNHENRVKNIEKLWKSMGAVKRKSTGLARVKAMLP